MIINTISKIPTVQEPSLTPLEPLENHYFIPNRQVSMSELYRYRLYEEKELGFVDTDDVLKVIKFLKANYDDKHTVGRLMSRAGMKTHKELGVSGCFNPVEMQYLLDCCDIVQARFLD